RLHQAKTRCTDETSRARPDDDWCLRGFGHPGSASRQRIGLRLGSSPDSACSTLLDRRWYRGLRSLGTTPKTCCRGKGLLGYLPGLAPSADSREKTMSTR